MWKDVSDVTVKDLRDHFKNTKGCRRTHRIGGGLGGDVDLLTFRD